MPARPRRQPPPPDAAVVTILLAGLLAMTPLSIDMPLPALPAITRALGTDAARAPLMVTTFLLGFAAAQLLYGPLSDRFGRRRVLLGGVGLYCVAGLACASAPSFAWLLVARLLHGVGACAGPVIARAVVRDVHTGARGARVLSLATLGMSLAPMVAPLTGGLVLLRLDWRAIFALLAGVGAALLLGVGRLLAETNVDRDASAVHPVRIVQNYGGILGDRTFRGYVITLAGGAAGLFSFISGSPFVLMTVHGLPPYLFGLAFAAINVGQVSGALLSARLTVRLGIDRTIVLGLACYLAGSLSMVALLLAGVAHVAAVVGPMAVFMLGNGMVMPNAMAGAIAPFRRAAGAASALAGFLQMVTGSLAGLALGRLHDGTAAPMTLMIAGSGTAAALAFWLLVARRRP